MHENVLPFKGLSKGPYFTVVRLSCNVSIGKFNNSYRQFLKYCTGATYRFFWCVSPDDSVCLAVAGTRTELSIFNGYVKNSVGHYFDVCDVLYGGRGAVAFNKLMTELFQQRKRTTDHCRSFGGSVQ